MPLEKQIVPIPFARGVDTKTDQYQVGADKPLVMQNAFLQSPKSAKKRYGYAAKIVNFYDEQAAINGGTTTGNITAGSGIWSFKNELTMNDGQYFYSLAPDPSKWMRRGLDPTNNAGRVSLAFPMLGITSKPVVRNAYSQTGPDSAVHSGGNQAFVWEDASGGGNGIQLSIFDTTTGTSIVSNNNVTANGTPTRPKVLTLGSNFFVIWFTAAGNINVVYLSATNPLITAETGVGLALSDVNGTDPAYDAAVINNKIYVAYNNTAGGGGISVVSFTTAGVVDAVTQINGLAAKNCITIFGDAANQVWIGWCNDSGNAKYTVRSGNLASQITAPTSLAHSGITRISGINISAGNSAFIAQITSQIYRIDVTTAASVSDRGNTKANSTAINLVSKPILVGGTVYSWIANTSSLQPTYFMMGFSEASFNSQSTPSFVAKVAIGTGGGATNRNILPEFYAFNSVYQFTFLQEDLLTVSSGILGSQTGVMVAGITFNSAAQSQEIANTLHLSGGQLWAYDGYNIVEHGFNLYPEIGAITQATTGGFIAGGATYQYVAVYEWMDAQGQVHRSAPSVAVSVVVPGGTNTNKISIPVPDIPVTNKTNVNVALYRTTANGTLFFRVNPVTPPLSGFTVRTYADTLADASITGNEELYTVGGEVPNGATPPMLGLSAYKNRLIGVPADNPYSWWFSKQILPTVPVEFSPFFVQNIDQRGGAITVAATLDDKLLFFKNNTIFLVYGDGPAPNGTGNDFTAGQLITTDCGCVNAVSLVATDEGLMFQSLKGIELLDRGLNNRYVGAAIEGLLANNTITSAVLYAAYNQVRFTLNNGTCLVYDYFVKDEQGIGQWYVYTNHSAVGATLFQNNYTYLQSGGTVMQESSSLFTDNGTFVQLKLQLPWYSFAQLQGYQRIYKAEILGTYKNGHNLVIGVAYDFDPTVVQTDTIAVTSTVTPYQWRILLERQKCEAIQFTINDTQNGTAGESMSLSGIALEVGAKGGLQRSPASQTYS